MIEGKKLYIRIKYSNPAFQSLYFGLPGTFAPTVVGQVRVRLVQAFVGFETSINSQNNGQMYFMAYDSAQHSC